MNETADDKVAAKARATGRTQAFPGEYSAMTLREYMATACLQGLIAAPYTDQLNRNLAADAVTLADALLVELVKR